MSSEQKSGNAWPERPEEPPEDEYELESPPDCGPPDSDDEGEQAPPRHS